MRRSRKSGDHKRFAPARAQLREPAKIEPCTELPEGLSLRPFEIAKNMGGWVQVVNGIEPRPHQRVPVLQRLALRGLSPESRRAAVRTRNAPAATTAAFWRAPRAPGGAGAAGRRARASSAAASSVVVSRPACRRLRVASRSSTRRSRLPVRIVLQRLGRGVRRRALRRNIRSAIAAATSIARVGASSTSSLLLRRTTSRACATRGSRLTCALCFFAQPPPAGARRPSRTRRPSPSELAGGVAAHAAATRRSP